MVLKITLPILLISQMLSPAQSHGYPQCPQCSWAITKGKSKFSARINFEDVFKDTKFPETGSVANYKMFMSVWDPKTLNLMDMVINFGVAEPGSDLRAGRCSTQGVPIKMPQMIYYGKNADHPDTAEGVRHQGPVQFFCDDKPFMLVLDFQTYNNPGNKGLARVKLTNTGMCANATTFKVYWLTTQAKDEGYAQAYIAHYNIDNNKNEHGFSPLDQKFCPKEAFEGGSNGTEGSENQNKGLEGDGKEASKKGDGSQSKKSDYDTKTNGNDKDSDSSNTRNEEDSGSDGKWSSKKNESSGEKKKLKCKEV
uniref:AlNc14C1017G12717 protein n=1 Tax=Albugo laibachii Nc14 TaxID=890382 RepID=F0X2F2_9STRA|nr:AlNc14C1017G12717 [Albugo laibachii Nc14]|eukprot:CCA28042.1 AlNc14C1017G12717 [Albugo laibachii Nc14]